MLDIRLPYFYNLPIALLLVVNVVSRVETVLFALGSWHLNRAINWGIGDYQIWLYVKVALVTLPALTAALYFFQEFQRRNDVYVRELVFILSVVNILGYLIPAFLP